MIHKELIIIGGGPIGIACGLEAQKRGLDYLILEKGTLVNSLFHYPVNMQFFSSSEKLEIDGIPFISKETKPKRSEALEYYRRIVTSNNLRIHLFEKVEKAHKEDDGLFHIHTIKADYTSDHLVVATGFYDLPNLLNIPGESLEKVRHYYNDPHFYAMQKLAVVGASNSAVDAALECYRKGARVTMIVRGSAIGERVKYWVKPDIENRIKEGSIKAYFNAEITAVEEKTITITQEGKEISIENDYMLALTGYQPDFSFLRKMGVELSDDGKHHPKYDENSMETNIPGLYLAGVICGGMDTHLWFIENSRIHAHIIMDHLCSNNTKGTDSQA